MASHNYGGGQRQPGRPPGNLQQPGMSQPVRHAWTGGLSGPQAPSPDMMRTGLPTSMGPRTNLMQQGGYVMSVNRSPDTQQGLQPPRFLGSQEFQRPGGAPQQMSSGGTGLYPASNIPTHLQHAIQTCGPPHQRMPTTTQQQQQFRTVPTTMQQQQYQCVPTTMQQQQYQSVPTTMQQQQYQSVPTTMQQQRYQSVPTTMQQQQYQSVPTTMQQQQYQSVPTTIQQQQQWPLGPPPRLSGGQMIAVPPPFLTQGATRQFASVGSLQSLGGHPALSSFQPPPFSHPPPFRSHSYLPLNAAASGGIAQHRVETTSVDPMGTHIFSAGTDPHISAASLSSPPSPLQQYQVPPPSMPQSSLQFPSPLTLSSPPVLSFQQQPTGQRPHLITASGFQGGGPPRPHFQFMPSSSGGCPQPSFQSVPSSSVGGGSRSHFQSVLSSSVGGGPPRPHFLPPMPPSSDGGDPRPSLPPMPSSSGGCPWPSYVLIPPSSGGGGPQPCFILIPPSLGGGSSEFRVGQPNLSPGVRFTSHSSFPVQHIIHPNGGGGSGGGGGGGSFRSLPSSYSSMDSSHPPPPYPTRPQQQRQQTGNNQTGGLASIRPTQPPSVSQQYGSHSLSRRPSVGGGACQRATDTPAVVVETESTTSASVAQLPAEEVSAERIAYVNDLFKITDKEWSDEKLAHALEACQPLLNTINASRTSINQYQFEKVKPDNALMRYLQLRCMNEVVYEFKDIVTSAMTKIGVALEDFNAGLELQACEITDRLKKELYTPFKFVTIEQMNRSLTKRARDICWKVIPDPSSCPPRNDTDPQLELLIKDSVRWITEILDGGVECEIEKKRPWVDTELQTLLASIDKTDVKYFDYFGNKYLKLTQVKCRKKAVYLLKKFIAEECEFHGVNEQDFQATIDKCCDEFDQGLLTSFTKVEEDNSNGVNFNTIHRVLIFAMKSFFNIRERLKLDSSMLKDDEQILEHVDWIVDKDADESPNSPWFDEELKRLKQKYKDEQTTHYAQVNQSHRMSNIDWKRSMLEYECARVRKRAIYWFKDHAKRIIGEDRLNDEIMAELDGLAQQLDTGLKKRFEPVELSNHSSEDSSVKRLLRLELRRCFEKLELLIIGPLSTSSPSIIDLAMVAEIQVDESTSNDDREKECQVGSSSSVLSEQIASSHTTGELDPPLHLAEVSSALTQGAVPVEVETSLTKTDIDPVSLSSKKRKRSLSSRPPSKSVTSESTSQPSPCSTPQSALERCGSCDTCRGLDCRQCRYCKDKRKYGGKQKLKQACEYRNKCIGLTRPPESCSSGSNVSGDLNQPHKSDPHHRTESQKVLPVNTPAASQVEEPLIESEWLDATLRRSLHPAERPESSQSEQQPRTRRKSNEIDIDLSRKIRRSSEPTRNFESEDTSLSQQKSHEEISVTKRSASYSESAEHLLKDVLGEMSISSTSSSQQSSAADSSKADLNENVKSQASRSCLTEIKTFEPTMDEFENLTVYVTNIEKQGANKYGIAKIRPPKEWVPRQKGYDVSKMRIPIKRPVVQTVSKISDGVFLLSITNRGGMSILDFERSTFDPLNKTPTLTGNETLESKYWSDLTSGSVTYGTDVPHPLTDKECKIWNIRKLDSILTILREKAKRKIEGVNTAVLYIASWKTSFPWHIEDMDLYSINYLHLGEPKYWYTIAREDGRRFERLGEKLFEKGKHFEKEGDAANRDCDKVFRHKRSIIHPTLLKKHGIDVKTVVQEKGDIIVTFPLGYHSGFNTGFNIAESVNFALPGWVEYGKRVTHCACRGEADTHFTMHPFVKEVQGEERYKLWKNGNDIGAHPLFPDEIGPALPCKCRDCL